MVTTAANWQPLPVQRTWSDSDSHAKIIPHRSSVTRSIHCSEHLTVESVEIEFDATHSRRGQLEVNSLSYNEWHRHFRIKLIFFVTVDCLDLPQRHRLHSGTAAQRLQRRLRLVGVHQQAAVGRRLAWRLEAEGYGQAEWNERTPQLLEADCVRTLNRTSA